MTTKMLDVETVTLVARQMWMNETKDMTLFIIQSWTLTTIESGGVRMTIVLKRKIMNEMMTTFLPSVQSCKKQVPGVPRNLFLEDFPPNLLCFPQLFYV